MKYCEPRDRGLKGLSTRAINALREERIESLSKLLLCSKKEIERFRYIGKGTVREIESFLNERGLQLNQDGRRILFTDIQKEVHKANLKTQRIKEIQNRIIELKEQINYIIESE